MHLQPGVTPEQLTEAAVLATNETPNGSRGDVFMNDGITPARPASYDKKVGLVLQRRAPGSPATHYLGCAYDGPTHQAHLRLAYEALALFQREASGAEVRRRGY
jgi:hypothetical protein